MIRILILSRMRGRSGKLGYGVFRINRYVSFQQRSGGLATVDA
jgi:hypothetical protein